MIDWMTAVFAPKTTTGADQSSRVRNSYGTTEFPGISVNGEINDDIELELVAVPEMGYFPTDKPHPRGEIRVRHKKNLFSTGYWRKPTESAKAFQVRWTCSCDSYISFSRFLACVCSFCKIVCCNYCTNRMDGILRVILDCWISMPRVRTAVVACILSIVATT